MTKITDTFLKKSCFAVHNSAIAGCWIEYKATGYEREPGYCYQLVSGIGSSIIDQGRHFVNFDSGAPFNK